MTPTALDAPPRSLRALQIGMTAASGRRGGVDRYYFGLLRALESLDVRSRGLVVGDRATIVAEGLATPIDCFAPDGSSLVARWRGLRAAVEHALPATDVVVSHFAPYAFPALDRIRGRPLIVHFHGPWALESKVEGAGAFAVGAKRLIERAVYRGGARFVALSEAFATILADDYGVNRDDIRVIPGGVDVERFRTLGTRVEARRALGWAIDRPTIVTVRRLVRAKGLERLIDAAAHARAAIADLAIHIVGTGPLAAELAARVRAAGLEQTVFLDGFAPEEQLPTIYRAADLFVVPTVALEGFGLVVVEALACGTPALVTPVAGLPDVVRDLDPRLVFASSNVSDIARGLIDAVSGRLPLPSEGACIAHARRFDWSTIARRVRDVYAEVAERCA